ncbi:MAG TPA: peptidoglycan DD-metalloendopeptidase family protein [Xanthobacteraceae bacterium]
MRDSAWAFVLPFGVAFAASSIALAQTAPQHAATVPPPSSAPSPGAAAKTSGTPDALKQSDQDLDAALAQQRASAENQIKLRSEIETLGQDRRKFNQQLIDTAARVREVEANINTTQERLGALDGQQRLLQNSLDQRHGVIVEVLAALQRMGQQPPPALMVRPEDALTAVRTAITLGAVLPEMRAQADALAGDLADMLNVRKQIVEQRDQLAGDLNLLGREQLRMTLLIDERQKKQAVVEQALTDERQRATDLAHQVDNIKDLIAKMETGLDSATRAAREANRAVTSDATQPELAALSDPGRLAPAVSFADMRGHMHLPVNGVRIREFGGSDGLGGTQKGLSIAARPGGEITAPCDGWVVYAGPFRSYGQLLILNAGGGYHVLLAGMERISVDLGQFVLTGEPVAVMGGGSQASPTGVTGAKQTVLYVEFRKDGAPIDPSPWWATNEGEKVRG